MTFPSVPTASIAPEDSSLQQRRQASAPFRLLGASPSPTLAIYDQLGRSDAGEDPLVTVKSEGAFRLRTLLRRVKIRNRELDTESGEQLIAHQKVSPPAIDLAFPLRFGVADCWSVDGRNRNLADERFRRWTHLLLSWSRFLRLDVPSGRASCLESACLRWSPTHC